MRSLCVMEKARESARLGMRSVGEEGTPGRVSDWPHVLVGASLWSTMWRFAPVAFPVQQ